MILKFGKIFLGFIFLFLFFILLVITFKTENNEKNNFNLEPIIFSGSFVNNIGDLDVVYTKNKENFKIEEKENNINAYLEKGNFIFSFNDLSKKYNIKSEGFSIDFKVPGDVYVSNALANNIIFSLNSIIEINFLSNDQKINSIVLYPHEYFIFNPKFNKIVFKGADIYRLRILNEVKNNYKKPYLKQQLSLIQKEDIIDFIGDDNIELFNIYINDKKKLFSLNNRNYKKLLGVKTFDFPLRDFIQDNKKYFLNKKKKSSFLQSEIFNELITLVKSKTFSKSQIERINSLKEELKEIDTEKYNRINSFNKQIYLTLLLDNDLKSYSKLENFLYLIEGKTNVNIDGNFVNLKKIYINYDYFDNGNLIVSYFKTFLDTYLKKSGIIEKDEIFSLNKKEKLNEVESFVFYLKEYINAHLFIEKDENFKIENDILSKYISLNKMIYFSGNKDKNKIKTSLLENKNILIKLNSFIRTNFFKEKRDRNGLLVIEEGKVSEKEYILLKNNINKIFELYRKNKDLLNKDVQVEFEKLYINIEEESFALLDYKNYIIEKNKQLDGLLKNKGLGAKKTKEYSIDDIVNYLSKFNGIEFSKNNIIKNKDSFEIKNVIIAGEEYNFILYPALGNILDIISLKDKTKFSYNLNEQEFLLKEKIKSVKKDEKEKYKFENFFILKLNSKAKRKKLEITEEYCLLQNKSFDSVNKKCVEKVKDDSIIAAFKQNKLLKEEFNVVKDFFQVRYNNLDVKQAEDGKYIIKLNNVETLIEIKVNNRKKKYTLFLSSDYDFYNHSLSNIRFKVKTKDKFLFDGVEFNISKYKKVGLLDLQKYLESFIQSNIEASLSIFTTIRNNFILYDFKITELFNKMTFKFNTGNKNIQIKFDKNNILSIIIEGKQELESPIHIDKLKDYITKMK